MSTTSERQSAVLSTSNEVYAAILRYHAAHADSLAGWKRYCAAIEAKDTKACERIDLERISLARDLGEAKLKLDIAFAKISQEELTSLLGDASLNRG
jgi:hypothetical protein